MELPFGRKSPRIWERMGARKGFGKLFFDFFLRERGFFLAEDGENGDLGAWKKGRVEDFWGGFGWIGDGLLGVGWV